MWPPAGPGSGYGPGRQPTVGRGLAPAGPDGTGPLTVRRADVGIGPYGNGAGWAPFSKIFIFFGLGGTFSRKAPSKRGQTRKKETDSP